MDISQNSTLVETREKMEPDRFDRWAGLEAVLVMTLQRGGLLIAGMGLFSMLVGKFPGVNMIAAVGVATTAMLVIVLGYSMVGSIIQRSGSDYRLVSMVLGRGVGFVSSFVFVVSGALFAGYLIAAFSKEVIPSIFRVITLVTGNQDYITISDVLKTSTGIILFGSMMMILIYALNIFSSRFLLRLSRWCAWLSGLALVMIFIQFLTSPTLVFASSWNALMGSGNYVSVLDIANDSGQNNLLLSLRAQFPGFWGAGLVSIFWLFFFGFTPAITAGEIKKPSRSLSIGMLTGVVLLSGTLIGLLILVYSNQANWITAQSYLAQIGSTEVFPSLILYAAAAQPGLFFLIFESVAWVVAVLFFIQGIYQFLSRTFIAWSEDAILPLPFQLLHPKTKSPMPAYFLLAIISMIGLVDASFESALINAVNMPLILGLVFVLVFLSLALMPYLRKTEYQSVVGLAKAKLGKLPVITLVGSLGTLIGLGMVVSAGIYPGSGYGMGVNWQNMLYLGILIVVGAAYWFLTVWNKKRAV